MSEYPDLPANFQDARAYYESLTFDELVIKTIAKDALLKVALERQSNAEKDSLHDSLTGLLNRRGLQEEYARKKRRRTADTVKPDFIAVIDLDDFKKINDTKGHSGGDESL